MVTIKMHLRSNSWLERGETPPKRPLVKLIHDFFVTPKVEQKFISIFAKLVFDKKMPSGWSPV
jgi:hypothetical protein